MSEKKLPHEKSSVPKADTVDAVQTILKDAELALQDKSRKLKDSFLANPALYTSIGISTSIALLPGIGPLLIAAGITGFITTVMSSDAAKKFFEELQKKKLKISRKKMSNRAALVAYKDAVAKQNAIIKALSDEKDADKERIEYLTALVVRLQEIIEELKPDDSESK